MGSGIAALFAARGAPVVLIDPVDGALDRPAPASRASSAYAAGGEAEAMARIRMSPDLEAAADCDLVIEAVPENLELKRGIFTRLDAICAPGAIFATNTSGLSINAGQRRDAPRTLRRHALLHARRRDPAGGSGAQRRHLGSHRRRRDGRTARRRQRPVLVRATSPASSPTASSTRWREAISLLEKGVASAEDIDEVVKWSLGIRLALSGPLEQRDMNGIDVHHAIASYLYQDLENRQEPSDCCAARSSAASWAPERPGLLCLEPRTPRTRAARKSEALAELAAWLERKAGGG